MTLLELLRQELPKRGGWPEGAVCISRLNDFLKKEKLIFIGDYLGSYFEDWDGNRVTREQYEAYPNECIRQFVAPLWNGEGLTPPVGCVCERSWAGDKWQPCKILFASNQLVVVKLKGSGAEDAYSIGDVTFRPLRTEAERAIDEMVQLSGVSIGAAKILYDAGYRK